LTPGAVAAERVVDREQPAVGLDRGDPVVDGMPEVDPADRPERVGVAAIGGDLLPGQQLYAVGSRHGGQLGVVADGVVIGHGQVVQAAPGSQCG